MRRTIEWLSVYCLENNGRTEEFFPQVEVSQWTSMVLKDDKAAIKFSREPSSWFTSLWTLQEACLRPDMLLCARNFTILTVGSDTAVTLASLAALLNFVIGNYDQGPYETIVNQHRAPDRLERGTAVAYEEINGPNSNRQRNLLSKLPTGASGVLELYDALVMSGMNKLFKISPALVFYLGQHRKCTSDRAEAVMSVVGATEWYKRHMEQIESAQLVLGCYPASFLNEAARKTGAKFYASVASDLANLEAVVEIKGGQWKPRDTSNAIGSLLPFTFGNTFLVAPEFQATEVRGRPSVDSWLILPDGRVSIRETGIISSTSGSYMRDLYASVLVPGIYMTGPDEQVNLHQWTREFWLASSAQNYANQRVSSVSEGLMGFDS